MLTSTTTAYSIYCLHIPYRTHAPYEFVSKGTTLLAIYFEHDYQPTAAQTIARAQIASGKQRRISINGPRPIPPLAFITWSIWRTTLESVVSLSYCRESLLNRSEGPPVERERVTLRRRYLVRPGISWRWKLCFLFPWNYFWGHKRGRRCVRSVGYGGQS